MPEVVKRFLRGAATVLDIMPSRPNLVTRPDFMRHSDAEKIGSDWMRVGNRLRRSISTERAKADGATK